MKKRSLFAAVAMLIVSAILLTSSTYAWFAAQHEATVAKVVAHVSGADAGNVQVSMSNTTGWTTSLGVEDILGTGVTYKQLTPVDIEPFTVGMETIQNADFDTTNYTVGTGSTDDMLIYNWYVRAVNRGSNDEILIPVTFSSGTCLYGVIYVDDVLYTTTVSGTDTTALWGTGGNDSYVSLGDVTSAIEGGTTKKGIIDSDNDTITGTLGAQVTANMNGGSTHTISIDISGESASGAGTAHKITVKVWAEGQDAQCVGGINVTDGGFTFGQENTGNSTGAGIHLG